MKCRIFSPIFFVLPVLLVWTTCLQAQFINCQDPLVLSCGDFIESDNYGEFQFVSSYNCPDPNFPDTGWDGVEKLYTFTLECTSLVSLSLTGLDDNLDLFLLGTCNPDDAIVCSGNPDAEDENIVITLAEGTYYVSIDGWNEASSAYFLGFECNATSDFCEQAEVIECGVTVQSHNDLAGSDIDSYICLDNQSGLETIDMTGAERYFQFTTPVEGDITITLDILSDVADLDVYATTQCCAFQGSSLIVDVCNPSGAPGESEVIFWENAPAGTKYIIVDGYNNGSSAFTITVECCATAETNCTIQDNPLLTLGVSHTFADINSDGFLDLLQYEQGPGGTTLIVAYLYDPGFGFSENSTVTIAQGFIDFSLSSDFTVTDLNNDNLVDLVVIRGGLAGTWLSGLINQGNNEFTAVNVSQPGQANAYSGIPLPGDVDNDGDNDVVACVNNGTCFAYINMGDETFTAQVLDLCLDANATLEPRFLADFDKNGYNDLLGERVTNLGEVDICDVVLYSDFNVSCDDCLEPWVLEAELAQDIGDVDNDGDLDILAVAKCLAQEPDTESEIHVLINEYPEQSFTIDPLENVDLCAICVGQARWKDIDADGDLDLGATILVEEGVIVGAIFENIDMEFHKIFEWPYYLTINWGDFDMDNEMDFCGFASNGETLQTYYASIDDCGINTPPEAPTGLTATTGSSGEVWLEWEAAFDAEQPDTSLTYNVYIVNGNGEVVVSPLADTESGKRRIVRHGAQSQDTFWHYTDLPEGLYTWYVQGIDHACAGGEWSEPGTFEIGTCMEFEYKELNLGNYIAFGFNDMVMADFSLDDGSLLDLLFKGSEGGTPNIFENQGAFLFEDLFTIDDDGDYVIGDLNTDNLMDVIVYGGGTYRIFFRSGGGFTQSQSFEGGFSHPVIGDIDNDGDRDILVGSVNHGGIFLIENMGNGQFGSPEQIFSDPNALGRHTIEIFDADGDGDLDLLTSVPQFGFQVFPQMQILYNVNGALQNPTHIGNNLGLVAVGDIDNDGDKDILNAYSGDCVECMPTANIQVYINNDGDYTLNEVTINPCDYTYDDIALGDLDQDGDLDLVSIQNENQFNSHLYVHRLDPGPEGAIVFNQVHEERFIYYFAIGDVDGDYDLDIIYPPIINECGCLAALVNLSDDCPNTPPGPPENITCIVSGDSLIISWDAASDAEQESQSLTYNIEVYLAASPARLIESPMSDRETGYRKLVRFGDQCHNLSWIIRGLDPDDYCVRVQAVDHSYAGGAWSEEVCCDFCPASSSTITIAGDGTDTTLCRGQDSELLTFEYVLNDPESAAPYIFLVTDEMGNIIGDTDAQFDFSDSDLGKYYVYGVSYFEELFYETGTHISNISSSVCDSISTDTICVRIDMAEIVFLPDLRICAGEAIPIVAATNGESCMWQPATGLDLSDPCFPIASPATTTEYTVTVTTAYGCQTTANVTVIVDPLPAVSVADVTICAGEEAILEVQPPGAGTCVWEPASTLDPAGCMAVATPEVTTTYTVTVTDINGCTATTSATVTIVDQPVADPGEDVELCAGECVVLTGVGGAECTWLDGITPIGTDCQIEVCPTETTTYTLIVSGGENCADTADVTVTVFDQPVADAGPDVMVCQSECITLTGTGGDFCTWYADSDFSAPISTGCTVEVCPDETTVYTLVVANSDGCMDTAEVTVTVGTVPQVFVSDASICAGETIQVPVDVIGSASCQWLPTTGLSDPAICDPLASPLTTTEYTITVTSSSGCTNTASLTIDVVPSPEANAGVDILLCEGDGPIQLSGSGGSMCTWYDSDGNVISNNCVAEVDVPASTFFVLEVQEMNQELVCSDTDTVNVEVASLPEITMRADTTICTGGEALLVADVNCEDCMCFWDPETGLSDPASCFPTATPATGTTTYVLRAVDINGCETTDSIEVTVEPLPGAVVMNDHYVIHQNRTQVFNVLINDEVTGSWQVVLVSGSPDVDVVIAPNGDVTVTSGDVFLGRTTFEYQLVDPACGEMSEIGIGEVVVIENDQVAICDPGLETVGCTVLSNIDEYPENRITIFNRYGNIVHLDSPYENDWDGLNVETGEPVPTGSYYFILELGENMNDGSEGGTIKGVLLIVRQGG